MKTGKDIIKNIKEEKEKKELKVVQNRINALFDIIEDYQNKEKDAYSIYENYHNFWMELQDFINELENLDIEEIKDMINSGEFSNKINTLYEKNNIPNFCISADNSNLTINYTK